MRSGGRLRFDPPADGGAFIIASVVATGRRTIEPPAWPKPEARALGEDALTLGDGTLTLRHDPARWGAFEVAIAGRPFAAGHDRPMLGFLAGDQVRWVDVAEAAEIRVEDASTGHFRLAATWRDPDGATWRQAATFSRQSADTIRVEVETEVDHERKLVWLPQLMVVPGLGSFGPTKTQGLFSGVEYLDDEPSSSEADVVGPAARRVVPAPHKITRRLMALAAGGCVLGLAWDGGGDAAPLFDSPDRTLGSGAHVLGLVLPGPTNDAVRDDGSPLPTIPATIAPGRPIRSTITLWGGRGSSVIPAVRALSAATRMPDALPDPRDYARLAARSWLETAIRDGGRFRHAVARGRLPGAPGGRRGLDDDVAGTARRGRGAGRAAPRSDHRGRTRPGRPSPLRGERRPPAIARRPARRWRRSDRRAGRGSCGWPGPARAARPGRRRPLPPGSRRGRLRPHPLRRRGERPRRAGRRVDPPLWGRLGRPRADRPWPGRSPEARSLPRGRPPRRAGLGDRAAHARHPRRGAPRRRLHPRPRTDGRPLVPRIRDLLGLDRHPIRDGQCAGRRPVRTRGDDGCAGWHELARPGLDGSPGPVVRPGLCRCAHAPRPAPERRGRCAAARGGRRDRGLGLRQTYPADHPSRGLLPDSVDPLTGARFPADINPGTLQPLALWLEHGLPAFERRVLDIEGSRRVVLAPGAIGSLVDAPGLLSFEVDSWSRGPYRVIIHGEPEPAGVTVAGKTLAPGSFTYRAETSSLVIPCPGGKVVAEVLRSAPRLESQVSVP